MALKINVPQPVLLKPKISIFGIGGAGGNALNNMIRSNLEGVEFIAANTDAQALSHSLAENKIQLGLTTTKGLGAGSFPDRGRAAAEENIEEILKYLDGSNMVFITAGMGGGTGTGAAPVIARLAREREILTVGVVTKPFHFEGKHRMEAAEAGIEELKKCVDTLIIIPNQNLFRIATEQTTFEAAFKMADNVLHAGVRGVTDLITMPGLVNLDFADIRTIMTKMGKALMGTGEASGENRAIIACEEAVSNPLLDDISIRGAKGVLVNMTGGPDMTLFEADLAVNTIKKEVDPNANIIFGSAFNEDMKGKIRISVVATGIDDEEFFDHRARHDDALKSKSQMVHEVKTAPASKEDEIVNVAMQGKKTFFDPGVAKKVDEDLDKSEQEYIEEELFLKNNFNHSPQIQGEEVEVVVEAPRTIKEEPRLKAEIKAAKENLFSMSDDSEREIHLNKKAFEFGERRDEINFSAKKEVTKKDIAERAAREQEALKRFSENKEATQKPTPKREGFSLFGFMNSGSKNNEDPTTKFEIQEKNFSKKQVAIIEDDNEDLMISTRAKFEQSHDDNGDDDMLNVPAFFRRKK